jgi:hypothetical protein
MLSPFTCPFPRMSRHAPRLQQPSPPSNDASPAAPSASPRAFAFGTRKLQHTSSKRSKRALRTTSWSRPRRPPRPAHIHRRVLVHAPHQAITIVRPKPSPRAGPGSSTIASSTPPHVAHGPRTSPHLPAPSQRGFDAHPHNYVLAQRLHLLPPFCAVASFTMLPPRLTAAPKGYRAVTVSTENLITNRAGHTRPPSPLSGTTNMFPFSDCRVEYSPS